MRFDSPSLVATAVAAALAIPGVSAQLNKLAQDAGLLYFGSALDNPHLKDKDYVKILEKKDEFGQITAANGQKWQFTEKTQGKFSFELGDEVQEFAAKNEQLLRCHTLVWYSQLPQWVSAGSWTKESLAKVMETHISNVMAHYKGKCYSWDVVNEAVDDKGEYRDNTFLKVLGKEYIALAFKAAAAADPDVKLYYNDYNIESAGNKHKRVLEIVKMIKAAGGRIDGVGCQAHLIVGKSPSPKAQQEVLKAYVDAGAREVAYTEVDIRHAKLPADKAAQLQQAEDYAALTKACLAVPQCVGITIWDFTDRYSWIPKTFPGTGDALLWDDKLVKKPAYDKVKEVLAAAAGGAKHGPGKKAGGPDRRHRRR